ncbi:MAG: protease complex subunit PrcB family protein [Acidobacteriota bacterium]
MTNETASTVPFRILDHGGYAAAAGDDPRPSGPKVLVAGSAEEASRLWSSMIGPQPMPNVDFSRESVVFLLLGVRSSGGFDIVPQTVSGRGEGVTVTAETRSPSRGEIVTQAFSAPYAVIAVSRAGVRSAAWVTAGEVVATSK